MRPRFQADENLSPRIIAGLLRREPSLDFQTAKAARLIGRGTFRLSPSFCTPRPEKAALAEAIAYMLYFNITMEDDMHTTNLRKVGGSVMLAVPPALLDVLRLRAGTKVGLAVESGRLVVKPQKERKRPRYTLDELLAQCDPKAARPRKERAWLVDKPVGGELI